jgi:hypothetical protein
VENIIKEAKSGTGTSLTQLCRKKLFWDDFTDESGYSDGDTPLLLSAAPVDSLSSSKSAKTFGHSNNINNHSTRHNSNSRAMGRKDTGNISGSVDHDGVNAERVIDVQTALLEKYHQSFNSNNNNNNQFNANSGGNSNRSSTSSSGSVHGIDSPRGSDEFSPAMTPIVKDGVLTNPVRVRMQDRTGGTALTKTKSSATQSQATASTTTSSQ